jgi:hydrogenase small subunit
VPTAFGGRTCWAWSIDGVDVTFQQAVRDLAAKASHVLCIGTCAAYGGIPAAGSNPTLVKGVSAVTNRSTINIAGCPPHPDWIVGTISRLLSGVSVSLDTFGRPAWVFGSTVHSLCPRRSRDGDAYGFPTQNCLEDLGCRGKSTRGNCPTVLWNNRQNWCVNASAPCYACTEPTFPGSLAFYSESQGSDD